MRFPSHAEVEALRKRYPAGTRIRLISIDDPYTKLRSGDKARVIAVDDAGQLVLAWNSGSRLSLIPGIDQFEIINQQEETE